MCPVYAVKDHADVNLKPQTIKPNHGPNPNSKPGLKLKPKHKVEALNLSLNLGLNLNLDLDLDLALHTCRYLSKQSNWLCISRYFVSMNPVCFHLAQALM